MVDICRPAIIAKSKHFTQEVMNPETVYESRSLFLLRKLSSNIHSEFEHSSRKLTYESSLVFFLFLSRMSYLQSNIKSLKANITESKRKEQKPGLTGNRTLQEAVNNNNSLESSLCKKENHIKDQKSQVCSYLTFAL